MIFGDNFFNDFLFLAETFMVCVNIFWVVRNEISVESKNRPG